MGHFSSSGYTALACNSIGNRKPSHYLQKSSRKEQFLCQEKTNTNICFKSLVTVYIKGLKMRIEYILMKTLSSLGMEVILLKLLIRKLTVCQVSYSIHYKWAFKTVMEIGKPKWKNVLALSNFLWSSLETQFSGMMLNVGSRPLKFMWQPNTVLDVPGRSTDETTCYLLQAAQSLMGKMDLKKISAT